MKISKVTKLKLQQAYENIIGALNYAGIRYVTENNIIQIYDPNARDSRGKPLPKPEEGSEGTGTAWIKCFFADRRQVYIYLCSHLVDCLTCKYDRFVTVYNYTDDITDTNIKGKVPITAVAPLPVTVNSLDPTIVYYTSYTADVEFKKTSTVSSTKTITLYNFFMDCYRDQSGYLKPIMPYNSSMKPISKLSDIDEDIIVQRNRGVPDYNLPTYILPHWRNNDDSDDYIDSYDFYKYDYKDFNDNYIPINTYKYIKNSTIDDMVGTIDHKAPGPNHTNDVHIDGTNYSSLQETITNYAIHCITKTFTDVSDTNSIMDFILYKDRNHTIIPLNNSLSIADSNKFIDFDFQNSQNNTFSLNTLDMNAIGCDYQTLEPNLGYNIMCKYHGTSSNSVFADLSAESSIGTSTVIDMSSDYISLADMTSQSPYIDVKLFNFIHNTRSVTIKVKIKAEFTKNNSFNDQDINPAMQGQPLLTFKLYSKRTGYDTPYETSQFELCKLQTYETTNYTKNGQVLYDFITTYEDEKIVYVTQSDYTGPGFRQVGISVCGINPISDSVYNRAFNACNISAEVFLVASLNPKNIENIDPQFVFDHVPVAYNYNGIEEGIYSHYISELNSNVNVFKYYQYSYGGYLNLTKADTYEINVAQNENWFKDRYFTAIYKDKLKSIYTKVDTRYVQVTCPYCSDKSDDYYCSYCKGTKLISKYEASDIEPYKRTIRDACTYINFYNKYKYSAHTGESMHRRCRHCAGTQNEIKYLFYNCMEFKNLSSYNGKTPVECDLDTLPTLDDIKALSVTVGNVSMSYLNYMLQKCFDIYVTADIAFDYIEEYDDKYKWILNNLVFYKLNGPMTKYYYWTGADFIEVPYGYNYIYSTKTLTQDEWDKILYGDYSNGVFLYKVLPEKKKFNDYIGFYVFYDQIMNNSIPKFQRIYFYEDGIYDQLVENQDFKDFNYFYQAEEAIDVGIHTHDDNAALVEKRCPDCLCTTCGGEGYVFEDDRQRPCTICGGKGHITPCNTCDNTGIHPDIENIELPAKYMYKYTSVRPVTINNISFETEFTGGYFD